MSTLELDVPPRVIKQAFISGMTYLSFQAGIVTALFQETSRLWREVAAHKGAVDIIVSAASQGIVSLEAVKAVFRGRRLRRLVTLRLRN